MIGRPKGKHPNTKDKVSVTMEFEPKDKFALSLLARIQRRPMNAVVLNGIELLLEKEPGLASVIARTFDEDAMTRLLLLEQVAPQYLSYDELVLLKEARKKEKN